MELSGFMESSGSETQRIFFCSGQQKAETLLSKGDGTDALKTKGLGGNQQASASSHLPRLAFAPSSGSPQSCKQAQPGAAGSY